MEQKIVAKEIVIEDMLEKTGRVFLMMSKICLTIGVLLLLITSIVIFVEIGPDTLGNYFECWFEDYLGQFVLMIASFAAALSVFTSSLLFLGFKKLLTNTSKTQD